MRSSKNIKVDHSIAKKNISTQKKGSSIHSLDDKKMKNSKTKELASSQAVKNTCNLTVLCVDIYQSTKNISEMDVEDAREWMEPSIEVMSQAIKKYGGVIREFTGDGLVAFFRNENHSLRGCFAALLLQKLLHSMDRRCHARVGMHSAKIDIEKDEKGWEEKNSITIAQKIQDYAPVDGVIVSVVTYDELAELLIVSTAQEVILEDQTKLICYPLLHLSSKAEKELRSFHDNQLDVITHEEKEITNDFSLPGERKYVTSVFVKLISEEHTHLRAAMDLVEQTVSQFDGLILKRPGDTLYAIFGAPISQEEHPLRACLAAYTIQKEFKEKVIPVGIKMGINSGEVVIDEIGGKAFHSYDVIGASVNLAARMMQTAELNQIQLSKYTFNLVKVYVDSVALGSKTIKGFNKPILTYALTGIKTDSVRSHLEKTLYIKTTFVGREKELKNFLEKYSAVKKKRGYLIGVNSEAGLGKSRLAFEFSQLAEKQGAMTHAFSASAYEQKESFSTLKKLANTLFSIESEVIDEQQEKWLRKLLSQFQFSERFAIESILALLDVEVEESEWNKTSMVVQKKILFNSLSECLIHLSKKAPLIITLDDGQWCDDETLAFLKAIPSMIKEHAILFILNHRSEFSFKEWFGEECEDIVLHPLDTNTCGKLAKELLPGEMDMIEVRERVISLSEGSPFLIQEYINMLIDSGDVNPNIKGGYSAAKQLKLDKMPLSVRGVVTARIDKLSFNEKQLLLQASILGKSFPLSFLEYIREDDKDNSNFKEMLSFLSEKGFIHEVTLIPEPRYTFLHNYIYEVAYESLLKKDKQKYHRRLAEKIEIYKKDHIKSYYTILAHHCQAGALWGKAVEYYDALIPYEPTLHFQVAQYLSVPLEAKYCYEQLSAQEKHRYFSHYSHTQMMYVYGLFAAAKIEQMFDTLGALEQENQNHENIVTTITVKLWFGLLCFLSNQCHAGLQIMDDILLLCDTAKKKMQPQDFDQLMMDVHLLMMHLAWPIGDYQRVEDYTAKILNSKISFDEKSPYIGSSPKAIALLHYSLAQLARAQLKEVKKHFSLLEEVIHAGLPVCETSVACDLYFAMYYYGYGDLNKAHRYLLSALQKSEEMQFDAIPFLLFPVLIPTLFYMNHPEEALSYAAVYKEVIKSQDYAIGMGMFTLFVVETFARSDALEDAWEILDKLQGYLEADDEKPNMAQCYRVRALMYNLGATDNSHDEEIVALLNKAMAIANEVGCYLQHPWIELEFADFYQRLGNTAEQDKHYQQALAYFKQ